MPNLAGRGACALPATLLFIACGDPSDEEPTALEPVALVSPDAWVPAAADDDPFDDRPDSFSCPDEAYGARDFGGELAFDVETGTCEYLTVRQPAAVDLAAGSDLTIRLWHFDLLGAAGMAHAAIAVGEDRVWETEIPIPADSELLLPTVPAPRAVSKGEPVFFHVHNHGVNSWSLLDIMVATP